MPFHGNAYTSESLCELASELLYKPVECMRFNEIVLQGALDSVWAYASLLHVPRAELPGSIAALIRALKPRGVMYCSFKLGEEERVKGGRLFTDMTEDGFRSLMSSISPDAEVETWITEDKRPDRNENWLNAVIKT